MTFPKTLPRLMTLFIFLGLATSAFAEKLKIATVDMSVLVPNYHRFKAAKIEQANERAKIAKDNDERINSIVDLQKELKILKNELDDPAFSQAKKQSILEIANEKNADLKALEREREVFLRTRENKLGQKMARLQQEITDSILEVVNEYAATQDVDIVIEKSGRSSSDVPFILYLRNEIDLTDAVLPLLNKDAPPEIKPEKPTEDPAE